MSNKNNKNFDISIDLGDITDEDLQSIKNDKVKKFLIDFREIIKNKASGEIEQQRQNEQRRQIDQRPRGFAEYTLKVRW